MKRPAFLTLAFALAVCIPAAADAQEASVREEPARSLRPALARAANEACEQPQPSAEAKRPQPGSQTPDDPRGLRPLDLSGQAQSGSGTSFNPSISVIPDGVYYYDDRKGAAHAITSGADGFSSGARGEAQAHGSGVERGFTLRELEVSFSGAVDPYFDAWAVVAIGGGEVEAEEAYVQTRRFLPGVQVRFGKFFSGIGYLNRQHPHQWDFVDQALPYSLNFGGSLNEVGVQATWLPALPVYAQFGFEALQGENERFSQHLGPGEAAFFRDAAGPRLFTGFVKVSPDLGDSHTLQAGFSLAHSRLHQERGDEITSALPAQGTTTLVASDIVYRFDSGKQWGLGDLTLQAEYLWRSKDMQVAAPAVEAASRLQTSNAGQDALYVQGVYGFAARWTAGLRFETAGLVNQVETADRTLEFDSSRRFTANVTFNPTEFSRLRLQYARGDFAVGAEREKYHQLWVQLQVSLGAHGAHTF